MPIRITPFYSGGYYHIFNRGNRKQEIFYSDADYFFFLNQLKKYKEKFGISLICYCLMPNHFHFLVQQITDISVSTFMQGFCLTYAMYINEKYNFVGSLFQNRFKAKHVDSEGYLIYLSKYIHTNPLEITKGSLETYRFSSYPEYLGIKSPSLCDNKEIILSQFSKKEPATDYRTLISEGFTEKEANHLKRYLFNE